MRDGLEVTKRLVSSVVEHLRSRPKISADLVYFFREIWPHCFVDIMAEYIESMMHIEKEQGDCAHYEDMDSGYDSPPYTDDELW